jgi:hypothetical protein
MWGMGIPPEVQGIWDGATAAPVLREAHARRWARTAEFGEQFARCAPCCRAHTRAVCALPGGRPKFQPCDDWSCRVDDTPGTTRPAPAILGAIGRAGYGPQGLVKAPPHTHTTCPGPQAHGEAGHAGLLAGHAAARCLPGQLRKLECATLHPPAFFLTALPLPPLPPSLCHPIRMRQRVASGAHSAHSLEHPS